MRSKAEMLADSKEIRRVYQKAGLNDNRVIAVRIACDVVDLLAALKEKDAEIGRLKMRKEVVV